MYRSFSNCLAVILIQILKPLFFSCCCFSQALRSSIVLKHLYILIDYLCVPARLRNRGIGAQLLAAMRAHYRADTVFLWEAEAPVGDAEQDELILRRLGFYRRCGAVVLGYDCALFGVHFKTLCCAADMPDESVILRKHQEIYLRQFGQARYDQFIQIPLHPGEKPFPVTDWTEE